MWNRFIYKCWSPWYNVLFNRGKFMKARSRIFSSYPFQDSQHILLIGVGTGADLAHIPLSTVKVTGIDLSLDMLHRAVKRYSHSGVHFLYMDAEHMAFQDDTYHVTILSLILSVVASPAQALNEAIRVTKPGGDLIVFDKFTSNKKRYGLQKLLSPFVRLLGTDINVSFENLVENVEGDIEIIQETPIMFNGMYRKIVLRKK
ncbi:class I SAM-dependent methyltransferase [Salibacterium qingdaonense]|nr:class I SAM-dependent methyltransferase [Salibacterium qingdaonense]